MIQFKRPRPVVLCVLDGWGYREDAHNNSIALAKTPNFDRCWKTLPHALLDASEEHVGLPAGQMGNSEVGHAVLGAGRIVRQDLPRIDRAIASGELAINPVLRELTQRLKQTGGTCHLLGLASPGGVHSHLDHIEPLAREVTKAGVPVALHAFLDGRDTPPRSAGDYISQLHANLTPIQGVTFATLCGRYYGMDRDMRWDRVEKAYDLLVSGVGAKADDPVAAIKASYAAADYDEFVLPVALGGYQGMKDGDGILHANFRADRSREILTVLLDPDFSRFARKKTVAFAGAAGMVEYSGELNSLMGTLFPPETLDKGAGEIVSLAGLWQLRIAETEKYAHVTFFFSGGRETVYPGEERVLIPSPRVATYDRQPEMSAVGVTDKLVAAIASGKYDFIVVNYANADMVGHAGLLDASIKAVEAVDQCLGRVIEAVGKQGGAMLITADHGNCERMKDEDGEPHTAHTLERVPVILAGAPASVEGLHDGNLAGVAPTLLELMGLPIPPQMTGKNLLVRRGMAPA